MADLVKIAGVKEVINRLYTVKGETAEAMERALLKAGLFLQKKSQEVVPVDTGALRASAFTQLMGKGFKASVVVGYTMFYAIYVHENLEARHKPGKIAKYLEKPARQYRLQMIKIIRDEAQRRRRKR